MSDSYQAIVDLDVTLEDSDVFAKQALDTLINEGLIQATLDPEATLGGNGGYRPSERIWQLYSLGEHESDFWNLITNGVEVETGPWFNMFGTTCLEGITCPQCGAGFELNGTFGDRFGDAVGEFINGNPSPLVDCPECQKEIPAPEWNAKPHLGFSNLAIKFWNWPLFDSPGWKLDIPELIQRTLNHRIVVTHGRV